MGWVLRAGIFRAWIFPLIRHTRCLSVEYHLSNCIAECRGRKPRELPGTQEGYVAVTLLLGTAALYFHRFLLAGGRWIVLLVPLYWVFELAAFILRWLFSDRGRVISFQRSLAGFLLNVVGVVVFFAAAFIGLGCVTRGTWVALRSSFRIFTSMGSADNLPDCGRLCAGLVIAEGAMGYLLTVVVIGAAAALVAAKRQP